MGEWEAISSSSRSSLPIPHRSSYFWIVAPLEWSSSSLPLTFCQDFGNRCQRFAHRSLFFLLFFLRQRQSNKHLPVGFRPTPSQSSIGISFFGSKRNILMQFLHNSTFVNAGVGGGGVTIGQVPQVKGLRSLFFLIFFLNQGQSNSHLPVGFCPTFLLRMEAAI